MKKIILLSFISLVVSTISSQAIHYDISFPNIQHHEALISVAAENLSMKSVIFKMSRSSPGRYATHEFGKNIYDVKAFNKLNQLITINQIDGDVYEVPNYNGYVRVQYLLFANYADGTYAGIDPSSVHLNMPASFLWVKSADKLPIDISFNLTNNSNWTIATQLTSTNNPFKFTAPGLQYFMDSPVKIGHLIQKNWEVKNIHGKNLQFQLAIEAQADDSAITSFAKKVERITQEAKAVFGEFPAYDYGKYTFLASINPYVHGDGMEHRNSTMITIPSRFSNSDFLLGVFSHEFFHCWNVERIRPKTIEPFNFEKSNMSNELWLAEGFTQYYGDLIMVRASFLAESNYLNAIGSLINTKENTQGAKRLSPAEASRHAVFVDAGTSIDKTNYPNMYTSYYPYGAAIALALDLELSNNFRNLSLDNYMTALWNKFGKTEIPYTIPDLEKVLVAVTGDTTFATNFFKNYINGHNSFNYKPLLAKAGLLLKKSSNKSWWGNVRFTEGNGLSINTNTIIGTPLYDAGLDVDDQITMVNGVTIKKQIQVDSILAANEIGNNLQVDYLHRGEKKSTTVKLIENPAFTVVYFEKEGLVITAEMLAFRKKWFGTKIVQ